MIKFFLTLYEYVSSKQGHDQTELDLGRQRNMFGSRIKIMKEEGLTDKSVNLTPTRRRGSNPRGVKKSKNQELPVNREDKKFIL